MFPAPHDKARYAEMKHRLRKGVTPAEFGLEHLRQTELLEATRAISAALPTLSDIRRVVTVGSLRAFAAARTAVGKLRARALAQSWFLPLL